MAACSCVAGALFGAKISLIGAFNRPDMVINRKVSSHTRKPLNCHENCRRFAPVQAVKSLFSRSKRENSLFLRKTGNPTEARNTSHSLDHGGGMDQHVPGAIIGRVKPKPRVATEFWRQIKRAEIAVRNRQKSLLFSE